VENVVILVGAQILESKKQTREDTRRGIVSTVSAKQKQTTISGMT
jgi:hypothetical protein